MSNIVWDARRHSDTVDTGEWAFVSGNVLEKKKTKEEEKRGEKKLVASLKERERLSHPPIR